MRVAYLDCMSGVSGDMTLGALVDCGVPLAALQEGIDSLQLPSCQLQRTEVKKHGFRASKVDVIHEPEHAHRHLHHITELIDGSSLTDRQKDLARRIFTRIGEAEALVHGTTIEKVHFHEVGAVDSIADIVGAAAGIVHLGLEHVTCSTLSLGSGTARSAHGPIPVPVPAVLALVEGSVPVQAGPAPFESTTPTGAAIMVEIADGWGPMPPMTVSSTGLGAGARDPGEVANVLRLVLGERADR